MKTFSLPSAGLLVIVMGSLFGAACGSEVSGGSGSSSSSSSSSGAGGSGTTEPAQACADTCHKLETLNCNLGGGADCNTQCNEQIAGYPTECASAVDAFFSCLVMNTTSCDFPTVCNDLEESLATCKAMYGCADNGICFGGGGMNGETSCGCDDVCKGTKYGTDCTTMAGSNMTTCDCLVNDASVGTCQQAADTDGCGVQDSCCNATYFKL